VEIKELWAQVRLIILDIRYYFWILEFVHRSRLNAAISDVVVLTR